MTKVYMRNPWDYLDLIKEINHGFVSWDFGSSKIRKINPLKFLRMRFGEDYKFSAISVAVEGAAEYDNTSKSPEVPNAVYPSWHPNHGFDRLIELCKHPVGEDARYYNNTDIEKIFRPIAGQPHKILVYDFRDSRGGGGEAGRNWFGQLMKIQNDYPQISFIGHGTVSFRAMFVSRFDGVTYNPSFAAKQKGVTLPNGLMVPHIEERFEDVAPWANAFGFKAKQLLELEDRIRFNRDAVLWAADYFISEEKFRFIYNAGRGDEDLPDDHEFVKAARADMYAKRGRVPNRASNLPGDGVVCSVCSFAAKCRYFREGAVCGVPSSESAKLAKLMGSRDADSIIEGLSIIAEVQARRVGEDLKAEEDDNKRYPDTDRRLKDLFDSGQKIARLVKPELNGKGVQVNVGVVGGTAIIQQRTPQELVSSAIRALESKGIPRERITEEAILGLLEGVTSRRGTELLEDVIEAELVE